MFSRFFLSERDLEAIQQALTRNPLLASLMMISPLDAFRYLNLMPKFFDALLPAPTEDVQLAQQLLRALQEGRTALDRPQFVLPELAPPPEPAVAGEVLTVEAAQPEPAVAEQAAQPDIALSISKATLQHAVRLYAESNFRNQEFVFAVQRWLDVNARGETVALDLAQGRARVIVRLRGSFAFRAGARLDLLPRKIAFPIQIELRAGLSVDAEDRLFLSVREGELSIVTPPLPGRVATDLVGKIIEAVPSIPLVQVPTRFEIPGEPAAELVVRLAQIRIGDDDLKLEFQLHV